MNLVGPRCKLSQVTTRGKRATAGKGGTIAAGRTADSNARWGLQWREGAR